MYCLWAMLSQFSHSTEWVISFQSCLALMYLHCYSIQWGCVCTSTAKRAALHCFNPLSVQMLSRLGHVWQLENRQKKLNNEDYFVEPKVPFKPLMVTSSFNSGCCYASITKWSCLCCLKGKLFFTINIYIAHHEDWLKFLKYSAEEQC